MDNLSILERIRESGHRIKRNGFNFKDFYIACRAYWPIALGEPANFSQRNIRVVSEKEFVGLEHREDEEVIPVLWPFFPEEFRKRFDIAATERMLREAVPPISEADGDAPARGMYISHGPYEDTCFVRDNLFFGGEDLASNACHELTHRHIFRRLKELQIPYAQINSDEEEMACKISGNVFRELAFRGLSLEAESVQTGLQEMKGELRKLFDVYYMREHMPQVCEKKAREAWVQIRLYSDTYRKAVNGAA